MKVVELFKTVYPAEFELSLEKSKTGGEACTLQVPSGFSKQALVDFGLMSVNADEYLGFIEELPRELTRSQKCKIAYFKGLFWARAACMFRQRSIKAKKRRISL